jgi:hypothetical protein
VRDAKFIDDDGRLGSGTGRYAVFGAELQVTGEERSASQSVECHDPAWAGALVDAETPSLQDLCSAPRLQGVGLAPGVRRWYLASIDRRAAQYPISYVESGLAADHE